MANRFLSPSLLASPALASAPPAPAARIVLELKDKLPPTRRPRPASAGEKLMQDALSALINLGYPKNLAEKALEAAKALGAGSLEDLLRQSLKSLAK